VPGESRDASGTDLEGTNRATSIGTEISKACAGSTRKRTAADADGTRHDDDQSFPMKLRLERLNFQILRRSYATLAVGGRKGTTRDVQTMLRHTRPDTTFENYVKDVPESVYAMSDAMYEAIAGPADESVRQFAGRGSPVTRDPPSATAHILHTRPKARGRKPLRSGAPGEIRTPDLLLRSYSLLICMGWQPLASSCKSVILRFKLSPHATPSKPVVATLSATVTPGLGDNGEPRTDRPFRRTDSIWSRPAIFPPGLSFSHGGWH
jgi:hypothetical protein